MWVTQGLGTFGGMVTEGLGSFYEPTLPPEPPEPHPPYPIPTPLIFEEVRFRLPEVLINQLQEAIMKSEFVPKEELRIAVNTYQEPIDELKYTVDSLEQRITRLRRKIALLSRE